MINIWRVLHAADECPVVTELRAFDGDGGIAVGNIPNPDDPVLEPPRCCGVWDRPIVKNLQGGKGTDCGNKTFIQESRVNCFCIAKIEEFYIGEIEE